MNNNILTDLIKFKCITRYHHHHRSAVSLPLFSLVVSSTSTSPSTSGSSLEASPSSSILLISTSISSIGSSLLRPNPTFNNFYNGYVKSAGLSIRNPEFNNAIL